MIFQLTVGLSDLSPGMLQGLKSYNVGAKNLGGRAVRAGPKSGVGRTPPMPPRF